MKEKMEKLKKELEKEGINVSNDALFIASFIASGISEIRKEIRDSRNILLWALGIQIAISLAILVGVYVVR